MRGMQNSFHPSRRAPQLLVLEGFVSISSLLLIGANFVCLPIALPRTSPHDSYYLTLGWQPRCVFFPLLAGGNPSDPGRHVSEEVRFPVQAASALLTIPLASP